MRVIMNAHAHCMLCTARMVQGFFDWTHAVANTLHWCCIAISCVSLVPVKKPLGHLAMIARVFGGLLSDCSCNMSIVIRTACSGVINAGTVRQ